MQLSRLTTAVALATALVVPAAMSTPAYAATTTYTVAVGGFSPSSATMISGTVVTVEQIAPANNPNVLTVYKASWELAPRPAFGSTTVNFSGVAFTQGLATITALGGGVASPVFIITEAR